MLHFFQKNPLFYVWLFEKEKKQRKFTKGKNKETYIIFLLNLFEFHHSEGY